MVRSYNERLLSNQEPCTADVHDNVGGSPRLYVEWNSQSQRFYAVWSHYYDILWEENCRDRERPCSAQELRVREAVTTQGATLGAWV